MAARPESIMTWKRSAKVMALLESVFSGQTPLTHEGLDSHQGTAGREANHLRAILMHHGLLPHRDLYLVRFELWIQNQILLLPSEVARPVEQFAKWHHLRRIRPLESPERNLQRQVHSAKQEVTETIKFLKWLWQTHERTAASCTQQDVDTWQASGPTTRKAIRTFFTFAKKTGANTQIRVGRYDTSHRPFITPQQRLNWLRELLEDNRDSLPYRIAGILLLLYAQPLTRVAALRISAVTVNDITGAVRITLGKHPLPVPQPFAELLKQHIRKRPNLGTGTGAQSPWLFPGGRAGQHLSPNTLAERLLDLGLDLRGARNTALDQHVIATPAPLIADALGYSYEVAHRHAEAAGDTWSRYIANRA
ncbi:MULTISPECIES: recombinase XerD [unclassified Paenarthrobacter]|uniref:recombinase XerD n=3 Tax=Paenarthrobacter TaxID=1742992 RepID=UPI00339ADB43